MVLQVEGERLLLEASHKRAAALTEIQTLKTEGGIGADPRIEATPLETAGAILNPWPLKPLTIHAPSRPGTGPMTGWESGVTV